MHWITSQTNKLKFKLQSKTELIVREAQSKILYPINWWESQKIDTSKCIVINGFWRSGTTWLQDTLSTATNAKAVFEPFAPRAGYFYKAIPEINPPQSDPTFLNLLMPYQDHNFGEGSYLKLIVDKALLDLLPHRNTQMTIRPISYYSRDRVVVKFVRASLCLKAIYNDWPVSIIHIYRDPRALIHTIMRIQYWRAIFEKLSLSKQLLQINDGRKNYFSRWENEIVELDQHNLISRLTAYWALTEKYLLDSFHNQQNNNKFYIVNYDEMILGGSDYLKKILEEMKIEFNNIALEKNWNRTSPTSVEKKFPAYGKRQSIDRLYSWKSELNQSEQDTIRDIVKRFGLDDRLRDN
ncbi:sulfotransferase domain-containing protein [Coleofasciculus sp. E2-BRE-01]|uniref:sulfotransferase domain-containing protein n=1 Tax=Coleofasciculus sp. E2-BRE-01 TaxID=3069524 RepID=UPI0032FD7DF6